jgi:hypothetical protein
VPLAGEVDGKCRVLLGVFYKRQRWADTTQFGMSQIFGYKKKNAIMNRKISALVYLPNQSRHSDCPWISGVIFSKNSKTLSRLLFWTAFITYRFNRDASNFLTAEREKEEERKRIITINCPFPYRWKYFNV